MTAKTQIKGITNNKKIYAEIGDPLQIIGQGDPVLFMRNMRTNEKFPIHKDRFNEIHEDSVDSGHREPERAPGSHPANKVESTDKGNGKPGKSNQDAIQGGHSSAKQIGLFD